MRFLCEKDDLYQALQTVSRAVSQRSPNPMYENVYLQAYAGGIRLVGTDQSLGIEALLPGAVQEEGSVLLPGRLFPEIIRKLPEGEVSLEVNERFTATIRMPKIKTTLQGMDAALYPSLPAVSGAEEIAISQALLKDMIRQTGFAIAQDATRPILTGCLFEAEGDTATMVALDGFRLALRRGKLKTPCQGVSCVISGKYWAEIGRILSDSDEEVSLRLGEKHASLQKDGCTVVVSLLDGEFIRYRQLLPGQYQTSVLLDRATLTESIDRASLMAKEGRNNLLKFSVKGDQLSISSNSEMGDVFEQMDVQTQGQDIDISFNVNYITDAIRSLSEEKVLFRFNTSISPAVIVPEEGDHFLYLVLPVRTFQGV